jgi:hypothetical protein
VFLAVARDVTRRTLRNGLAAVRWHPAGALLLAAVLASAVVCYALFVSISIRLIPHPGHPQPPGAAPPVGYSGIRRPRDRASDPGAGGRGSSTRSPDPGSSSARASAGPSSPAASPVPSTTGSGPGGEMPSPAPGSSSPPDPAPTASPGPGSGRPAPGNPGGLCVSVGPLGVCVSM